MRWLRNTKYLIQLAWELSYRRKSFKRESQQILHAYVEEFSRINDGSITRNIFLKLKDYPLEALFAANMLAGLHRYQLTLQERKSVILCGAVLALGDVFCDDTDLTEEQVEKMIKSPTQVVPGTVLEACFLKIYVGLISQLDKEKYLRFHEALMQGFEAEKQSRRLLNGKLSKEEVMKIVKNKGGCSLLIYRSLLDIPLTVSEQRILWHAGAFTQLIDDIFDVCWDLKKGVQTFATESKDFLDLKKSISQHLEELHELLALSELQGRSWYKFIFVFQVFRLGTDMYLRDLEYACSNTWNKETILSLHPSQFKFRYFTMPNLLYVIPRALAQRY